MHGIQKATHQVIYSRQGRWKITVIVAVTYAGSFDINKSCSIVDVAEGLISHRECSFVNAGSTRSFANTWHAFISEHS
jgi:hypothetical protein